MLVELENLYLESRRKDKEIIKSHPMGNVILFVSYNV